MQFGWKFLLDCHRHTVRSLGKRVAVWFTVWLIFRAMAEKNNFIDGIQVLRAIAAIMVVMLHAKLSVPGSDHWPSWGGTGVDIFFVISGYVMSLTTEKTSTDIKSSLWAASIFTRKRVARIVPMYWIVLAWTARRDSPDLNLLKDFFFIPHRNETFPDEIWPSVIQGWTLNYEMFFYGVLTVAFIFGRFRLVGLLILLTTTMLVAKYNAWDSEDVAAQFYSSDIIFEFAFGVILERAISVYGIPQWNRGLFLTAAGFGFALLAICVEITPRSIFSGLPALLIVWCSLRACKGWLNFRWIALLGDSSYAIYIFHWASFGAMKPIAGYIGPAHVNILMVGHVLTAIGVGCLVHLLVEKRATNWAYILLRVRSRGPEIVVPAAKRA